MTPTIIGVADSIHYLVGAVDSLNNFVGLNQPLDIITTKSLVEAKELLRAQHFTSAVLEFQTAYDEMCGTSTAGPYRQIIEL
jgi:hypothetical protein